jgi:demethylmenaquinone methyltransferase/2-methoxy-6-polyprenyl-1,4-benzoquinol methylase
MEANANANSVRAMFGAIAHHYDFLNHLLSGNTDRRWRRKCVDETRKRTRAQEPRILDIGCGTADLALAFSSLGPVIGCDFCRPMLQIGKEKAGRTKSLYRIELLEGDAQDLPFPAAVFDIVASAFALRNFSDARKGLIEMRRVLRSGGTVAVLDFSMPQRGIVAAMYRLYFLKILPSLGTWISKVDGAYHYLPNSVQSFAAPEVLKAMMIQAGFTNVEYRLLTGGIAVLLVANVRD